MKHIEYQMFQQFYKQQSNKILLYNWIETKILHIKVEIVRTEI